MGAGYVESDFDKSQSGDYVRDVKGAGVAQVSIDVALDEFVSFELNYLHVGKQTTKARAIVGDSLITGDSDLVSNGVGSAVVLRYPLIERVHLLLRGDFIYFRSELDVKRRIDGASDAYTLDDSAWQAGFGVGAEYQLDTSTSLKGM